MISNIFKTWQYIKTYCYQKSVGNGFYDWDVTPTHWQTAYAWREVLSLFFEPSTTKVELDAALEYYCQTVFTVSEKRWLNKLWTEVAAETYEDFFISASEVEFINIRYSQWFNEDRKYFEFHREVPNLKIDLSLAKPKRKQNRFNVMTEEVINEVKNNFERHTGTGKPVLILCVDNNDAKQQNQTRHLITFRDAYKSGINKLQNEIRLSEKAREVLYGNR